MSALLRRPQSVLQLRCERTVGRWRAAGRREQVEIETDAGFFNDDVGSVNECFEEGLSGSALRLATCDIHDHAVVTNRAYPK
jgi:hypothetical protein